MKKSTDAGVTKTLARLRPDGRLEDFALRWGVPHVPEFEMGLFRRLFGAELRSALAALAQPKTAERYALRGRVRRLLGDPLCSEDFRKSLDLKPGVARVHAWLGESGLGDKAALGALDTAVALDPKDGWARAYRAAGRLLAGDAKGAANDASEAMKRLPSEALPALLAGLAYAKTKRTAKADRAYRLALRNEASCSAAALLRAKLWTGTRSVQAAEEALEAEPDHAHVALFTWTQEKSWAGWLSHHVDFCFADERTLPLCTRFGLDETRFSPYHFDAVELAAKTLKLRGRHAWTLATYGRALARAPGGPCEKQEARKALDEAVKLDPRAGWTWAWRGLSRIGNDPDGALADLDKALSLSPHYFRAYGWRGSLLRRRGRLKDSLADLDRAVGGEERYPFSSHERSLTRRLQGDLLGAVHDLDRAYALDPRYSWVYAPGREPSARERDHGLKELDRAIARHPSCASLRAWKGELLTRAGRLGEAVLSLEDAVALDPAHALALGFLGLAYLEAGRPQRALDPLRRSVKLDGRHLQFRGGYAEALRGLGRKAEAEKVLADALAERPKAWTLKLQRARWRLDDGRAAAGLSEARAAAALEGRDAEAYFLEARALALLGRWKDADAAIERALVIAPNQGRAFLLRAEIRRALGRADEAVADFRVVHERFPYLFNDEQRAAVAALLRS
ncbi:MAG: tetratricopeptide repeat protein [Elusimicrobia bacterium]|nr:tetratricopeptide repeat protein [Elusimicrobiota bacterium]